MANYFSDLVDDDAQWGNPDPDYTMLLGVMGAAAVTHAPEVKTVKIKHIREKLDLSN